MNALELIIKKRDGRALSYGEINFMVTGFVKGDIPDYQMAAFLMAIYLNGMNPQECVDLTMAMVHSGDTVDLSDIKGFKVDKHSTGGVGDTTTLVLTPLVAASGGIVAKMTGRELGHTGGTVDKLEAIPGMQVDMSKDKFVGTVNKVHAGLITQTATLAPADKMIYALRNATGTIGSIPLIASSIMSKKLAAGADGIILDVKTGSGAFMEKYHDALALAKTMVDIGAGAGKKVIALITNMEQPLGYAIGNALEVKEAIDTLSGNGPEDLVNLVMELGSSMLTISGVASSKEKARETLKKSIETRNGLNKFGDMIEAQGGDRRIIYDPQILLKPGAKVDISSVASGYVHKINALDVGIATKILGEGSVTGGGERDYRTGIYLKKKVGDPVKKGEPMAVFYSDGDSKKLGQAKETFLSAYHIKDKPPKPPRLIYAEVRKDRVTEYKSK